MSKRLTGKVVSNKMEKTVVVAVELPKRHPVYDKLVRRTKKVKARTDKKIAVGALVVVEETSPFSKEVTWMVVEELKGSEGK